MRGLAWRSGAGILAVVLLWVWAPLGALAFMIVVAAIPPWGRTLIERAAISTIVVVGAAAVVFPRASSTPVDVTSVRVFLTAVMVVVVVLNLLPAARVKPIPRPRLPDVLIVVLVVVLWFVLVNPMIGGSPAEVLSGLYFAGWDNHAHYTTFANTYVSQSTSWATADGSLAWNQWYPSLHSTIWALGALLLSGAGLDRVELLVPYVQWSALSFALAMGALAWIATDLSARWTGRVAGRRVNTASIMSFTIVAAWLFLGTPQFLFNAGFTNFTMGAVLVATASYVSVRSPRSARILGWFVVPLAAISTIGLWTPLVLGLVPAGVIVAVGLIRYRVVVGVLWLLASAGVALAVSFRQLGDVLSAGGEADAVEFATDIGGVAVGMAPFNVMAALVAPIVGVAIAVLVNTPWTLRWGLAGPSVMTAVIAATFVPGVVAAGAWWLDSYYVQKALEASLLVTAPLLAAAAAVVLAYGLRLMSLRQQVATVSVVGLFGFSLWSDSGIRQEGTLSGLPRFPGLEALDERSQGQQSQWLGDLILSGVAATAGLPAYAPVLWEGPGTLANLWTGSLHGTLSSAQQVFYLSLPQPPLGDDAAAWAKEALNAYPELRIAFVPPSPDSADFLRLRFGSADPRRVVVVTD